MAHTNRAPSGMSRTTQPVTDQIAPGACLVVDGYAEGCQHGDVDPPFAGRSTIWFDPHMGQTAIRPNWRLMGCKEAVMIGTRIAGITIRLLHPAFHIAALWSVTAGLIGHSQGGQQDDRQQFQPRRR